MDNVWYAIFFFLKLETWPILNGRGTRSQAFFFYYLFRIKLSLNKFIKIIFKELSNYDIVFFM